MTTVILVCGGRKYASTPDERNHMYRTLDAMLAHYGDVVLVHGDAPGADKYAGHWAMQKGVVCAAVPAPWAKRGPAAGPIRNSAMLALRPHVVAAFPGGKGTADMVAKARAAGVPTYEV